MIKGAMYISKPRESDILGCMGLNKRTTSKFSVVRSLILLADVYILWPCPALSTSLRQHVKNTITNKFTRTIFISNRKIREFGAKWEIWVTSSFLLCLL